MNIAVTILGFVVLLGYIRLNTERKIMAAIDDLTREVTESRTAVDSAVSLIEGLKARLDEAIASGDMAQVQTLSDELSNNTDRLAAAVAANTPQQPGQPGTGEPGTPVEPGTPADGSEGGDPLRRQV